MSQAELPDWSRVLFDMDARYIAIHGGRGSGKSRSIATALILRAYHSTLRVLCAREIQNSIKDSSKRLLDDEIKRLKLDGFFTSTDTEIRGTNGSLFIFVGLRHNIDSIKSMEGIDIVWVDEAQKVSKASLEILVPTIRKPKSQLIFSWNPKDSKDPIDEMFRGTELPPKSVVQQVNFTDNPWFPDELAQEMEFDKRTDYSKYLHVWMGEYLQRSDAKVFRNWRIDDSIIMPDSAIPRFGADWGFARDPTVLVRAWLDGKQLFVDYAVGGVGIDTDDIPALFDQVPLSRKYDIIADSARPETISALKKQGFRVLPSVKGKGSIEDGITWLQSHEIVVHPRCVGLIDNLARYQHKEDPLTGRVLPTFVDKHNDCIAAGQRVLTERGYVPIEEVTTDDKVMTRGGWRRVLFADVVDVDRQIVKVTTTVGEFLCTPDHKVWTSNGFARADALRYDDEVIGDSSWPTLNISNGADSSGDATQIANISSTECTSSGWDGRAPCCCTGQCGSPCMDPSQTGITFTTSTTTPATTTFPTSPCSQSLNTVLNTSGVMSSWSVRPNTSPESVTSPRSGTPATLGERCTAALAHWRTGTSSQNPSLVSSAQPCSRPALLETETISAPTTANQHIDVHPVSTTSTVTVASVGSPFGSTDTAHPNLVPGRVLGVQEAGRCDRVYDLTVEEHHEFIVEGVLVSNCIDALRYMGESIMRAERNPPPPPMKPAPVVSHWNAFNQQNRR